MSYTAVYLIALGLAMDAFAVSIASGVAIRRGQFQGALKSGVFLGGAAGHFFEKKLEAAGGLVLIGIGIKILLEHLR